MATVVKAKKPTVTDTVVKAVNVNSSHFMPPPSAPMTQDLTVEKYLEKQFEEMIKEFRNHTDSMVAKLRKEYQDGAQSIMSLMESTTNNESLCVVIKCLSGPHIGQKFRLQLSEDENDNVFKVGRSTGKAFKEHGISLYKDKEISTSHAKFEIRNGQVFLVDSHSTNGTQLNGKDVEPAIPYRLKDEDKVTLGSSELSVHLTSDEN